MYKSLPLYLEGYAHSYIFYSEKIGTFQGYPAADAEHLEPVPQSKTNQPLCQKVWSLP